MKLLFLLFFLFLSISLFAKESNPLLFCNETESCTPKMQEITDQYKMGNGKFTKEILSAFSGSCYHISSLYDPNYEHHGAFYFEHKKSEFITDGIFSFFYNEDPYQEMNSNEVKAAFLKKGSVPFKAIKKRDHAELRIKTTETSDYHYWFRTNENQDKMFLIGMQFSGTDPNFVFCEFSNRR